MTLLAETWPPFVENPPAGVRYVRCKCGKHVVHVKREKERCPYDPR